MTTVAGEKQMTSNEQRNLDLTAQLYEAAGRGDWDAAADMLSDDFFATEAPGLPFAVVYRGKRALEELFG
jgi:ketosteroid isomerase-like protein